MLKPKAFFLPLLLIAAPAAADPIEDGGHHPTVIGAISVDAGSPGLG